MLLLRISKFAVGITVRKKEKIKIYEVKRKKVKTKTIGTLLMAGLVVISVTVVFADTAAAEGFPPDDPEADPNKIYGYITDGSGNSIGAGHTVEIRKDHGGQWHLIGGTLTTDDYGYYDTGYVKMLLSGYGWPSDNYRMYLDGNLVATTTVENSDWDYDGRIGWWLLFSYGWNHQIPEFATIAIPAIAVLGLFLFFNRRKQRK
ncbi:hypothetical protein C5S36_11710 [Candidatus Methanophagaceae archaeon]|jgi:hypothetical protein|nr:hypothetical protein C5S36_11710 [Methanophagales archaeon]